MKALLECILATTFASLVVCSVLRSGDATAAGGEEDDIAVYNPRGGAPASQIGYSNLLNYLESQQRKLHDTLRMSGPTSGAASTAAAEHNDVIKRRFTDFNMPYMKYKVDKRNDGIWIWMPAQGYVAVPHQQEDQENALHKQGKIMRYGK